MSFREGRIESTERSTLGCITGTIAAKAKGKRLRRKQRSVGKLRCYFAGNNANLLRAMKMAG